LPRSDAYVLGGTAEAGEEDTTPDLAVAAAIIARCAVVDPEVANLPVLSHAVGLRPGRPTVRLEAERPQPGALLVHNYGHGGAGITLSWGCAEDAVRLVLEGENPPA
jgi:D-amino-acid oxidase